MKKLWFLLISISILISCDDIDDIPSDEMVDIITEALLTSSIADSDHHTPLPGTTYDTVDYYSSILNRYGYTIEDFRYTIRQMAARKSNPLNEIFERVSKGIDSLASVASFHYGAAMRYDTLVLKFYADTIYRKDTTIKGSLKKYKFDLKKPLVGNYTVTFKYRSVSDYRSGSKALTYRMAHRGESKMAPTDRLWLNRALDTSKFIGVIKVAEPDWDSIIIGFEEPVLSKDFVKQFKDTSFINSVMVVYTPALEQARKMYYYRYFEGIKLYEIIRNAENILPLPFGR